MEEKERYEFVCFDNNTRWKIIDNKTKQEVGGIDNMIKLLNQQDQKIADIEAKLEQSQKEKELDNAFWKQECDSLQKALAEKESEVKVGEFWHSAYQGKQLDFDKVYAELRQSYDENTQLKQQLAEKEKEIVKEKTQDKISFAVAQLEKVYEYTADVWWVDGVSEAVCNFIDQQIKELKEETNVKD